MSGRLLVKWAHCFTWLILGSKWSGVSTGPSCICFCSDTQVSGESEWLNSYSASSQCRMNPAWLVLMASAKQSQCRCCQFSNSFIHPHWESACTCYHSELTFAQFNFSVYTIMYMCTCNNMYSNQWYASSIQVTLRSVTTTTITQCKYFISAHTGSQLNGIYLHHFGRNKQKFAQHLGVAAAIKIHPWADKFTNMGKYYWQTKYTNGENNTIPHCSRPICKGGYVQHLSYHIHCGVQFPVCVLCQAVTLHLKCNVCDRLYYIRNPPSLHLLDFWRSFSFNK